MIFFILALTERKRKNMIIVSIELVQIIQKGGYMILLDMKDRRPIYEQLIEKLADDAVFVAEVMHDCK